MTEKLLLSLEQQKCLATVRTRPILYKQPLSKEASHQPLGMQVHPKIDFRERPEMPCQHSFLFQTPAVEPEIAVEYIESSEFLKVNGDAISSCTATTLQTNASQPRIQTLSDYAQKSKPTIFFSDRCFDDFIETDLQDYPVTSSSN
jgi:hypothetical protein